MSPAERFVEVDGVPVHLLTGGSGPPLVYLHGVAPAGEWLPVHAALAELFTVYAPDHPGFGLTDRPDWLQGMDDLVVHYDELFRILGLASPALVGFSLGGWLAAELAVYYPQRFSGLVLLNAAGLHRDDALIPDLPALAGEELSRALFHDAAAARAYFANRNDPERQTRTYRALTTTALLAWNPWFDPQLSRRLRRIQVPTLALWGEHDRLISPLYGETYRDLIPGARLEILPHCGHMAPLERPEAVARSIAEFLSAIQ
jgi:pimeloyl-ACP methyl ester carboxylesterase